MILDKMKKPDKSIKFPLSRKKRLFIIDRDATIFSSLEVAYACYEEAFDKVISAVYPPSDKLTKEEYTVDYHPFEKDKFYRERYPKLTEEQLEALGEASLLRIQQGNLECLDHFLGNLVLHREYVY